MKAGATSSTGTASSSRRPPAVVIRPARIDEVAYLSDLCVRSKAHWGYDAAFMAACIDVLRVSPRRVAQGLVLVAGETGEPPQGVAEVDLDEEPADLALIFVEPWAMGRGVGRALFEGVLDILRRNGRDRMNILSDPFAELFYLRIGAVRIGEEPVDTVPGRKLPLLRIDL